MQGNTEHTHRNTVLTCNVCHREYHQLHQLIQHMTTHLSEEETRPTHGVNPPPPVPAHSRYAPCPPHKSQHAVNESSQIGHQRRNAADIFMNDFGGRQRAKGDGHTYMLDNRSRDISSYGLSGPGPVDTGEETSRPFSCTVCDKQFKQSNHLFLHMRTHGDVKSTDVKSGDVRSGDVRSYECKFCLKNFEKLSHHDRHVEKHHRQDIFRHTVSNHSARDHSSPASSTRHPKDVDHLPASTHHIQAQVAGDSHQVAPWDAQNTRLAGPPQVDDRRTFEAADAYYSEIRRTKTIIESPQLDKLSPGQTFMPPPSPMMWNAALSNPPYYLNPLPPPSALHQPRYPNPLQYGPPHHTGHQTPWPFFLPQQSDYRDIWQAAQRQFSDTSEARQSRRQYQSDHQRMWQPYESCLLDHQRYWQTTDEGLVLRRRPDEPYQSDDLQMRQTGETQQQVHLQTVHDENALQPDEKPVIDFNDVRQADNRSMAASESCQSDDDDKTRLDSLSCSSKDQAWQDYKVDDPSSSLGEGPWQLDELEMLQRSETSSSVDVKVQAKQPDAQLPNMTDETSAYSSSNEISADPKSSYNPASFDSSSRRQNTEGTTCKKAHGPITCKICGRTFVQANHLKLHMRSHSVPQSFECEVCHEKFRWHFYYKRHMKKHHKTYKSENPVRKNASQPQGFSKSYPKSHSESGISDIKMETSSGNRTMNEETRSSVVRAEDLDSGENNRGNCLPDEERTTLYQVDSPFEMSKRDCHSGSSKESQRLQVKAAVDGKSVGSTRATGGSLSRGIVPQSESEKTYQAQDSDDYISDGDSCEYSTRSLEGPPTTDTATNQNQHSELMISSPRKSIGSAATKFSRRPVQCKVCGKSFKQTNHLYSHMRIHAASRSYECKYGLEKFRYPYLWKKHVRKHKTKTNLAHAAADAEIRMKPASPVSKMNRHCSDDKSASLKSVGASQDSTQTVQATTSRKDTNQSSQHRYRSGDRSRIPCKCGFCGKTFSNLRDLYAHMRSHKEKCRFACTLCMKSFQHAYNLIVHMRIHTGERPFKCSVCKQGFKIKVQMINHMKQHVNAKEFQCMLCSRSYEHKHNLNRHLMRSHSNDEVNLNRRIDIPTVYEGKDVCNVPETGETDSGEVQRDERISTDAQSSLPRQHSGQSARAVDSEIPCKCGICKKMFHGLRHLQAHMKRHAGKRSFACALCKKNFSRGSNLVLHMRKHKNEKPFKCIVCAQNFRFQAQLTQHMSQHSNSPTILRNDHERPTRSETFPCTKCGKSFCYKGRLIRHMKYHQGGASADGVPMNLATVTNDGMLCHTDGQQQQQHGDDSPQTSRPDSNMTKTVGSGSGQTAVPSEQLKRPTHINRRGSKLLACKKCGKTYLRPFKLMLHMNTHQKERFGGSNEHIENSGYADDSSRGKPQCQSWSQVSRKNRHSCDTCGKTFGYNHNLLRHMRHLHGRITSFACKTCGKSYQHYFTLMRHMKHIHCTSPKSYACEICGKSYAYHDTLSRHMKTSHGRTFDRNNSHVGHSNNAIPVDESSQENLGKSSSAQSDMKPHACEICGKRYGYYFNLKRHLRINHNEGVASGHTHAAKSQSFTSISARKLNGPSAFAKGVKKLSSCKICGRSYKYPYKLMFHMNIHRKESFAVGEAHSENSQTSDKSSTPTAEETDGSSREYMANYDEDVEVSGRGDRLSEREQMDIDNEGLHSDMQTGQHLGKSSIVKGPILSSDTERIPHGCVLCDRLFPSAVNLTVHMITHMKPAKLTLCDIRRQPTQPFQ